MPTLPGPTAFGSLLKRLRVAAGLTQEALAEARAAARRIAGELRDAETLARFQSAEQVRALGKLTR